MIDTRRRQLGWIRAILEQQHWTPTALARAARIDQSTLSKFLGDPAGASRLSTNVVEKIEAIAPFPAYETRPTTPARGTTDIEATPLNGDPPAGIVSDAVNSITAGRNGLAPWVLHSRALEAAGYMPGDVLVVDLNAAPQDGDVVYAVQKTSGAERPFFRLLEAPFLSAASLSRSHFKPLLIERDRIEVHGVVIASIRPRLSLLAS